MSEKRWLASDDSMEMRKLILKRKGVSKRKLRLFACACLRCETRFLPYYPNRLGLLEVAERWCDGSATEDEVADAKVLNLNTSDDPLCEAMDHLFDSDRMVVVVSVASWIAGHCHGPDVEHQLMAPYSDPGLPPPEVSMEQIYKSYIPILRDLFPNPFRPVRSVLAHFYRHCPGRRDLRRPGVGPDADPRRRARRGRVRRRPRPRPLPGVPRPRPRVLGRGRRPRQVVARGTMTAMTRDPVIELLLSGQANTAEEAEEMYLDANLDEVVRLAESGLSESEFRSHPLIQLLIAHGSRPLEDSLW